MWNIVSSLCVTKGSLLAGGRVEDPTFRAVAPSTSGEGAALDFVYSGNSTRSRALASGQIRRQIGLKLKAANGCNLVYVMWRFDPGPQIEVSVKINPGAQTHAQCGAGGYTKLRGSYAMAVGTPNPGERHTIQAQLTGDDLAAWIDGQLAWQGQLPYAARGLAGPSGIRSDNISYSILSITAPQGYSGATTPRCLTDGED